MTTTIETEYLDLDDDGLPDAVRVVTTVWVDAHTVERVESFEWGIGDDGEPRAQFLKAMPTLSVAA